MTPYSLVSLTSDQPYGGNLSLKAVQSADHYQWCPRFADRRHAIGCVYQLFSVESFSETIFDI